jgi:hypothetical protein
MTAVADWLDDVVAAATRIRNAAARRNAALAGPPVAELVAVGLATVDLERLSDRLGGAWLPAVGDPLLGATTRRLAVGPGPGGDVAVLLLEPDMEGPLAAALARFGEGLAAVYVRPARPAGGRFEATGPFGPARLVPGSVWGPHVVALEPRATIER